VRAERTFLYVSTAEVSAGKFVKSNGCASDSLRSLLSVFPLQLKPRKKGNAVGKFNKLSLFVPFVP
jgi:hypothetical protein